MCTFSACPNMKEQNFSRLFDATPRKKKQQGKVFVRNMKDKNFSRPFDTTPRKKKQLVRSTNILLG